MKQQLYRIGLLVFWNNPELSDQFYLRLGGMHFLMSYFGRIESLMAETGTQGVLEKEIIIITFTFIHNRKRFF